MFVLPDRSKEYCGDHIRDDRSNGPIAIRATDVSEPTEAKDLR